MKLIIFIISLCFAFEAYAETSRIFYHPCNDGKPPIEIKHPPEITTSVKLKERKVEYVETVVVLPDTEDGKSGGTRAFCCKKKTKTDGSITVTKAIDSKCGITESEKTAEDFQP